MVFFISDMIIFNTLDCTVALVGEQRQLKLPLPACKLLETLLSKPGEVHDRDFLLTEVWDKQGLTGSNGNLNKYISILRRNFSVLGVDNIIQTVPRVGFMINKDVEVKVSDVSYTVSTRTDPQPDFSSMKNKIYQALSLFLTICSILFCIYSLIFKSIPSEVNIVKSTFNGCSINYLSSFSDYEVKKLNVVVAGLLSSHSIQCDASNVVFFDYYKSVSSKGFGRALLSVCQKDQAGSALKCNSFYYYDLNS